MNLLIKIIFTLNKPKIIIIGSNESGANAEAVFHLLKNNFKVKNLKKKFPNIFDIYNNQILILGLDLEDPQISETYKFLIKNSRLPILLINYFGDIPSEKEKNLLKKMIKILPSDGQLILNFDEETTKELEEETNVKTMTFGFQEGADFQATDITDANFKINYKGSSVPVWLATALCSEMRINKKEIYSVLGAIAAGIIFDLNLVEISNSLKNYKSPWSP